VCTINSTYVAISVCHSTIPSAIPAIQPFPPFDLLLSAMPFCFPPQLSIFLSGFSIFLNGFPFSKKSEKIYLRPVLGKRTCSTHHGRLWVRSSAAAVSSVATASAARC
jgi:hypothetical protein